MKVYKLGGTTVSSIDFVIKFTELLIEESDLIIIVLSALSGVTNLLEQLSNESCSDKKAVKQKPLHF